MTKPKGGRGYKAAYSSKTVRVPLPIADKVERLISDFHEGVSRGETLTQTYPEALTAAQNILHGKKSARESLKRFLAVLYKKEDVEL